MNLSGNLTNCDQQIGFVKRQLVTVENELSDTEMRLMQLNESCTCRRGN